MLALAYAELVALQRLEHAPVVQEPPAPADPRSRVLDLQRTAGNVAVTRMLARAKAPLQLDPIEIEGDPNAADREELEEVAAAMGLPVDDPRVRKQHVDIRVSAGMREAALKAQEQKAKAEAAKKESEKPPDPSDPHNWKQAPNEPIEAFLERQRKGLLAQELKRTGLTEAQLREQVLVTGTRTEERVRIGRRDVVMVMEVIPNPDGGYRTIKTMDIHDGDKIERTKTAHNWATGDTASSRSELVGGKETIVKQLGNQALFEKPKAPEPPKPKPAGAPHTKWTKLPDGRVKVDFVDEHGEVIPGQGYVTEALQSPQERIKAEQARDPNYVFRP